MELLRTTVETCLHLIWTGFICLPHRLSTTVSNETILVRCFVLAYTLCDKYSFQNKNNSKNIDILTVASSSISMMMFPQQRAALR